jgi:RNA polymerase sigma factor (sigma-70 family)
MGDVPTTDLRATVDAVWRMEAAKIVATLTRVVGDVGFAEDLAQEALVDALTQWPSSGVPRNAAAWLTTVAKRKAIDQWRRQERLDERYAAMARDLETSLGQEDSEWNPDRVDDDVLRLIFVAAHPVVAAEGRIALTLRVVGGLTTEEIARAFLVSTATVAQRIVRAKKTLAKANVPFEVPDRSEYPQRLSTVLSVIYLIYSEGYSASFGQRWIRDELCTEALRLGRVVRGAEPARALPRRRPQPRGRGVDGLGPGGGAEDRRQSRRTGRLVPTAKCAWRTAGPVGPACGSRQRVRGRCGTHG